MKIEEVGVGKVYYIKTESAFVARGYVTAKSESDVVAKFRNGNFKLSPDLIIAEAPHREIKRKGWWKFWQ